MRHAGMFLVALFFLLAFFHPCPATTIVPLDFSTMVERSAIVFEGTVVDIQTTSSGTDIRQETPKESTQPLTEAGEGEADTSTQPSAPQAVGVEGGRMIFTEVTLSVDRVVAGQADDTVTFRIAGGSDGQVEVTVFGMPQFEPGKRYVVFLGPDYQSTAAPITGVNQGFFQVSQLQGSGSDVLLNANGDIVLGIENDRVIVRHNPELITAPERHLGPAPVPEAGSGVQVQISPEVERYWHSEEPPLSLEDFYDAISSARGAIQ